MDFEQTMDACEGRETIASTRSRRPWWDFAILSAAVAVFVWLAVIARRPPLAMNLGFAAGLAGGLLLTLFGCGWFLWKKTRFV